MKNTFDKIIGYDAIKNELLQICDMMQNRERYAEIGAKLPRGLLLSGEPGLGKTMMCKAFIELSGLPAYTVRKNKNEEKFIASIGEAFENAKANAPSIVFLDDMDKFANEDRTHRDAESYVAVQAGIDDVAEWDVFVIATVNDSDKLPPSLVRSGRFDRVIEIDSPTEEDAEKIIAHFLSDKKVSPSVNMEDLCKMISYSSCAELETILNEAAVSAGFKRKENIEMADLVNAVLHKQYNSPGEDYTESDEEEAKRTALHEAGHLVCSEVLCPGSVGFASIRPTNKGGAGGFVHRCKELDRRPHYVLTSLAGKAAVELYHADHVASGCVRDISQAYRTIREGLEDSATYGFGMTTPPSRQFAEPSDSLRARQEDVTQALLENYMMQVRDILIQNRKFLELAAQELHKKGILLYSDVQRIKAAAEAATVA